MFILEIQEMKNLLGQGLNIYKIYFMRFDHFFGQTSLNQTQLKGAIWTNFYVTPFLILKNWIESENICLIFWATQFIGTSLDGWR